MAIACHGLAECKTYQEIKEENVRLSTRIDELELRLQNSYIALKDYGDHKDTCDCIIGLSSYCTCHYLTQLLAGWEVLGRPTGISQEEFAAGIKRTRSL